MKSQEGQSKKLKPAKGKHELQGQSSKKVIFLMVAFLKCKQSFEN